MATNIVTAEQTAVKAEIAKTITGYKGAAKAFVDLFVGLCERFTGKDNCSGDMFEHLLNLIDDSHKTLRSRVVVRLREFSDNTLLVTWDESAEKWQVRVKRDEKDKSLFDKAHFIKCVDLAKKAPNALTFSPNDTLETEEERAKRLEQEKHNRYLKRLKSGKIQEQVSKELLNFAKASLEANKDLTPEKLAINLRAMVETVLLDVKPVIEGNTASQSEPEKKAPF
ncbi:hypothetical protein DLL80_23885 [Salmonella enterica subsp. enterica serovar Newport]|uniref:Uncharacterized protein n=1 Tax=Salmonella newport TaxID=108619 RepID=A0A5V6RMJ3_SALNE|nr:hypothetical protein [Salmonella enterica subsp. enterica serovar Newport]